MEPATSESTEEVIRFIDETNDLLWRSRGTSAGVDNIMALGHTVLQKAQDINYRFGLAKALLNHSMGAFILENDAKRALTLLSESLTIFNEVGDKKWIANTQGTTAIIQNTLGNREAAIYNILKCLDFYENHADDTIDGVMVYYVAGTIYKDLKKYPEAEKYFLKGVEWKTPGKSNWSGRVFAGLASVYAEINDHEKALEYSFMALERLRAEGNLIGVSRAVTEIGAIYKKQRNYTTALQYLEEGLAIRLQQNLKQFLIGSYMDIAEIHHLLGNPLQAIVHLEKGMEVALEIKQFSKLSRIYQDLSVNYKQVHLFEKAIHYLEKQIAVNAEVSKQEMEMRIGNLHNAVVKEKEEEIERLKNVELKNAYDLITEKNKEITDSINYARRIQQGILPSPQELNHCFADHFVLYKPKDIVSGDFYWCKRVHNDEANMNVSVMAVVDCTGHGVPGAFMSMLGHTLLNQAVKTGEVTSPADALNYLNRELPHNLKSQDREQSIKDGMDLALCAVEWNTRKLLFAGANNPLWIVRNGNAIEIAPDKQAISASDEIAKTPFTNKGVDLEKGDLLYLFTDGYADQFGGPKGKKFKYSNLQKLLVEVSTLPLAEQREKLERTFESWKGALEQIDDVLIIGIRIL